MKRNASVQRTGRKKKKKKKKKTKKKGDSRKGHRARDERRGGVEAAAGPGRKEGQGGSWVVKNGPHFAEGVQRGEKRRDNQNNGEGRKNR